MRNLSTEIGENAKSKEMDLECLVCLEVPNGLVYSCQNDHLLCLTCLQVDKCPACRQDFVQLPLKRNTLAEAKIKDLKNECKMIDVKANHEKAEALQRKERMLKSLSGYKSQGNCKKES